MLNAGPLEISEFMAKNQTALRDGYAEDEDWIEIHNPRANSVVLDGWSLTDDSAILDKWKFPDVDPDADELTLNPDGYLLVFASENDELGPAGYWHTNFNLDGDGEYLALVQADGETISYEYALEFPEQTAGASYGFLNGQERLFRWATPGAANDSPFAVITEFMAINDTTLLDGDGFYSDWIEIYNPTNTPLVLDGWYLTDDENNSTRWQFQDDVPEPELTLQPNGYLIVFASGKNRRDPTGELHTNFGLNWQNGEYLALVQPDGATAWYHSTFDPQSADISYGYLQTQKRDFMINPIPGAANVAVGVGLTFEDDTSGLPAERGFYESQFNLRITADPADAPIWYTLDGSDPSDGDPANAYAGPIPVTTTTTVRVAAISAQIPAAPRDDDFHPTTTTQTYIFLDEVIQQLSDPAGFPAAWAGYTADYEMDTEVIGTFDPITGEPNGDDLFDGYYEARIRDDLHSIPTMSLLLDPDDLFDAESGIYSNPTPTGHGEHPEPAKSVCAAYVATLLAAAA